MKKEKKYGVLLLNLGTPDSPETKDVRSSVSIDLLNKLKGKVKNVYGWDAVIKSKALNELGFKVSETLEKAIGNANVVLIMNNHPDNICSDIYIPSKNLKLIFDGWNQLNKMEVEKAVGLIYSTMGYMTPND